MTQEPAIVTDVFDFLMGDGFVMVQSGMPTPSSAAIKDVQTAHPHPPREVWTGIEGDVERLERLLR